MDLKAKLNSNDDDN